jgi:type I restriction enzyme S subunit
MEVRLGYEQIELEAVPTGWNLDCLGNLCGTSSGTTPPRSAAERYYRNGTIYWVKTTDLTNSDISVTEELVTKTALDETSLRVYPIGTVLVAMYGGFNQIGRTGLLKVPAAVNQAITAIQTNPKSLVSEYLINYLNYRISYWKTVASSSRKDPNITSHDIKKFPIIFPDIREQTAIAAALSDVDALITSLDRLIAKKRDIKQAVIQQLLTGKTRLPGFSSEWERKKLGDVFNVTAGGDFDLYRSSPIQDEVYCYPIYSNALSNNGLYGFCSYNNHQAGSITVTARGTLGVANFRNHNFTAIGRVLVLQPSLIVDGRFL